MCIQKFHGNILSLSENIAKDRGYFFDPQCTLTVLITCLLA